MEASFLAWTDKLIARIVRRGIDYGAATLIKKIIGIEADVALPRIVQIEGIGIIDIFPCIHFFNLETIDRIIFVFIRAAVRGGGIRHQ